LTYPDSYAHGIPTTTQVARPLISRLLIVAKFRIENVFNSPNPVTDQTIFFVQHNRPRELLDVKISIFTMSTGNAFGTNSQEVFSSSYLIDSLTWDATTYSGQKVNKGTYLYTIELIFYVIKFE